MACLRLSLMGTFQAKLDEALLTGFESNKVRALLAYLALEAERPHSREALATLLWPDWSQQAAMTHLRNALADLRRVIGDREAEVLHLLVTHDTIQFNAASVFMLDVAAFQDLAGEALKDQASPERIARLEEAVGYYKGELLEGFSIGESAPFEEWVSIRREKLHRLMMQILSSLVELYLACGEYEQAKKHAERQIELEPWLEEAHRQLMLALALGNQRSTALTQYETCRQRLENELGVLPSEETIKLYEAIRDGRLDELRQAGVLLPAPGEPPFKGLLYFDAGDADLFFGREALTTRLVEHVQEIWRSQREIVLSLHTEKPTDSMYPPLLAVVGASGSGKSSLVRAGLAAALIEENWVVQVITPTEHPLEVLKGIDVQGYKSQLIIVDQFEEVFTLCREEEEREAFIEQLLDIPGPIVIVLRADFYAACARYPRLRQALCAGQEYIGAMSAAELRRAIEEPARRNGWELELGLVELILRDVGARADHPPEPGALPLLSHALLETWKRRNGRLMTLNGYAETDGVHGAIAKTAEIVYAGLDPTLQAITRRIFLRLTELGEGMLDTRRRAPLAELVAHPDQASQTGKLLEILAERRLITLSESNAEVAHEALIREWPALREWLREDREGLRLQRRLTEAARNWQEMNRDPSELYRGARLAQALEWASQNCHEEDLSLLEQEFLHECQAEAQRESVKREAQLQRELEIAHKLLEAEQQRSIAAQTAFARELAVHAELKLSTDPELSLLLALKAAAVAKSVGQSVPWDVQQALHDVVSGSRLVKTIYLSHQPWELACSPDGTRFAYEDDTYTLHVLEVATGRELFQLPDVTGGLAFSPDGKFLATGTLSQLVVIWDAFSGGKRLTLAGSTEEVWGIAFSPDGRLLATGNDFDYTASIWDLTPWVTAGFPIGLTFKKSIQVLEHWGVGLPPGEGQFHAIEFNPDGKRVATNYKNTAIIWEARSGKELFTLSGHQDIVMDLAFSPDGNLLATGSFDGTTRVWECTTGKELFILVGHNSGVWTVAFSLEDTRLAAIGRDGLTIVWDAADGQRLFDLASPGGGFDLAFSPGERGLITGHEDRAIRFWDTSLDGRGEIAILPEGRRLSVVAPSLDRSLFAIATRDGSVEIHAVTNSQKLMKIGSFGIKAENQVGISNLAFSLDNNLLAVAVGDRIQVWELLSGHKLFEFAHPKQVLSIAFSRDGKWLAAGGRFRSVIVRDVSALYEKGETISCNTDPPRWNLPVTIDYVNTLSFDPGGTHLAASGAIAGDRGGGLAFIWDLGGSPEQNPEPVVFVSDYRYTQSIEYSPDGKSLAIGGDDEHAEVWDMTTYECKLLLTGHHGKIIEIHFSPDGRYLVTASLDGNAKVWEAANGKELLNFKLPSAVLSAFFSADGQRVVLIPERGGFRLNAFLDFDELVKIGESRLSRDWKPEERRKYLHQDESG